MRFMQEWSFTAKILPLAQALHGWQCREMELNLQQKEDFSSMVFTSLKKEAETHSVENSVEEQGRDLERNRAMSLFVSQKHTGAMCLKNGGHAFDLC